LARCGEQDLTLNFVLRPWESTVTCQPLTRDQHFQQPGPKRILALDGGGLRGVISLGYLKRIETLLRERQGNRDDFRLAHYFDLIAGTSTGAIIAAGLAIGMSVDELTERYLTLGRSVFKASYWRRGILRDRYDEAKLVAELKSVFGERTLGDASLLTGLLVITKRMDTGSPWPLGNNPHSRYFSPGSDSVTIANADYPLWQVVRASTAAPTFFAPEKITIARQTGKDAVKGDFVDGGVSPYNNPALMALMYATLDGYRINWPTGDDKLLIISVGTGSGDVSRPSSKVAAKAGINALNSLMDDCAALVETVMQWCSAGPGGRMIDLEVGDLSKDLLGGRAQFRYRRYQIELSRKGVDALKPDVPDKTLASLAEMDEPKNLDLLRELGELASSAVRADDFPAAFDPPLPPKVIGEGLRRYRKRAERPVIAVPISLTATAQASLGSALFSYQKWDAQQTCKTGDWLVQNGDEVYTVDRDTFSRTYREVGPGQYQKTASVWAERVTAAGKIATKEGTATYNEGDVLVYNQADRKDGYAMSEKKFTEMYEPQP
jgi:hypothetical protein